MNRIMKQILLYGGVRWANFYAGVLNSGQTTIYHAGDDADALTGILKPTAAYQVNTTGAQSLTTLVNNPHYAAATISFDAASKEVRDSANGLVTVLAGDTIYVRNGLNAGLSYVVAAGGGANAAKAVLETAPVDEAAGTYITLCKQAAWSNNTVLDLNTGLTWLRYTSGGPALKFGLASDGKLCWYDATKAYVLHSAGADLQMIKATATLKIVGGAAEVGRYWVGMILLVAGFANAANNLPGRWVTAVTVNGADLDLTLASWGLLSGVAARNILVDEAAGGSRSIKVICSSIFSLSAAARVAGLGGYTDWRNPNYFELVGLLDMEATTSAPDATAFPSWPVNDYLSINNISTDNSTNNKIINYTTGNIGNANKATGVYYASLVRG